MIATERKPFISLLSTESNAATSIIGANRGLRPVLDAVRMVAPTDTAVLIAGETGTGKEVIAGRFTIKVREVVLPTLRSIARRFRPASSRANYSAMSAVRLLAP
jgi:hypothetical protein